MKKRNVLVTYKVELEIDENNDLVKDYESERELLIDCAIYRFSNILPVIQHQGVNVIDIRVQKLIDYE